MSRAREEDSKILTNQFEAKLSSSEKETENKITTLALHVESQLQGFSKRLEDSLAKIANELKQFEANIAAISLQNQTVDAQLNAIANKTHEMSESIKVRVYQNLFPILYCRITNLLLPWIQYNLK